MKAGTAQKMILNTLTTGAMTRLGYVYGNLMVNLHLKNEKLAARGISILEQAAGFGRLDARRLLKSARNSVPVALVMAKAGVTRAQAVVALKQARGHVRRAITMARAAQPPTHSRN
jgi:N-acetylmuramic acid 6-phosphate etherase